jgi:cyanoexosortase A
LGTLASYGSKFECETSQIRVEPPLTVCMKTFPSLDFKQVTEFRFWLVAIAAGLAAIHLTLVWRADNVDLLGSSILFFAALASLLGDRQHTLRFDSSIPASVVGAMLIALVLLRSLVTPGEAFLLLAPLTAGLGLALLASGFRGLGQYRQELLLLFCLGAPKAFIPPLFDPTLWTAKFSTALLWYGGFEVVRDGVNIHLPTGSVEVYPGCSGIEGITYLLSLAGLFVVMFPLNWLRRGLAVVLAVWIAFAVNGVRVSLMAYLVASSQPEAFEYWHEGTGSLIFSMIAVLMFGGVCWLLLRWQETAERWAALAEVSDDPTEAEMLLEDPLEEPLEW